MIPPTPVVEKRVVKVKKKRRVKSVKMPVVPWETLENAVYASQGEAGEKLNPKQELFCRVYAQNRALFGNATLSYAYAYGYNLEEMSHEKGDPVEWRQDEKSGEEIAIKWEPSEYDKAYNVCHASGSKLLLNATINKIIDQLMLENSTEDKMDVEMTFVAMQRTELAPKMSAIKEFNAVRGRIRQKIDHTHRLIGVVKHVYDIANKLQEEENKNGKRT